MNENQFTFSVITPIHTQDIAVEWIEVESPNGSFLVGPDHSPLVSILKNKSSIIYKRTDGSEGHVDVPKGILTIASGRAIALLDQ